MPKLSTPQSTLRLALLPLLTAAMLLSPSSYAQDPRCDRACLTGYVDGYLKALIANDGKGVPLAATVKITNNGDAGALASTFWDSAEEATYRWDIVDSNHGDTATMAVLRNKDGSKTIMMVRLRVQKQQITEVEVIRANKGDADALWDVDNLTSVSDELTHTILEGERDSHYRLIAAAESYFRAFQTNGTDAYKRADMLPDVKRFENGQQTTGMVQDGKFVSATAAFDSGRFKGRNLWDRRYAVVDEERGVVLALLRFGMQTGPQDMPAGPRRDRLVAEFFTVKGGMIQEIHAVLINRPDAQPTGWPADYSPAQGGAWPTP
jgi:hypothetical protein